MRRLILLRHAKAESASASGDFDRGLTDRGRRDAALMGRALADAGLSPDQTVVSLARRAQETWEAMAATFPAARVASDRALYLASCEQIDRTVAAARADPSVGVLMIIGHNPGLHEYAVSFLEQRQASNASQTHLLTAFPTASAAVFAFDAEGRGAFQQQLSPRDIGGGVL